MWSSSVRTFYRFVTNTAPISTVATPWQPPVLSVRWARKVPFQTTGMTSIASVAIVRGYHSVTGMLSCHNSTWSKVLRGKHRPLHCGIESLSSSNKDQVPECKLRYLLHRSALMTFHLRSLCSFIGSCQYLQLSECMRGVSITWYNTILFRVHTWFHAVKQLKWRHSTSEMTAAVSIQN